MSSPNSPEPFPSNLCPDIQIQSQSRLPVLSRSARHARPARVRVQSRSPPRFPPSLSFFFPFPFFSFPFFLFLFLPSSFFLLLPASALSRTRGAEHASTRSTPAAPCHPASPSRRAARLTRRPDSHDRQRAGPRACPVLAAGRSCARPRVARAALLAAPPSIKHRAACPRSSCLPELSHRPATASPPVRRSVTLASGRTPLRRPAELAGRHHRLAPPPPTYSAYKEAPRAANLPHDLHRRS